MNQKRMEKIYFHIKARACGWLSNFARYPIVVGGQEWPTSEHYYQAQKFTNAPEWMEAIRANLPPYGAWRMGRSPDHPRRPDWDSVKDEVMRVAVRAKFSQHSELQLLLLATGDAELVEHAPHDAYWGDGGDGRGQNMLGRVLMEVRMALLTADNNGLGTFSGCSLPSSHDVKCG